VKRYIAAHSKNWQERICRSQKKHAKGRRVGADANHLPRNGHRGDFKDGPTFGHILETY
jgi:hypothetical protein